MGEEGAGKGIYTELLCDLWGNEWVARNINDIAQMTGDNNRTLIGFKKLIVPNELQSLEHGKSNFDKMKTIISDDVITLRDLFEKPVTMRNVSNFIFSTNNYDSIKMGLKDRRYFVPAVSAETVGQIDAYFGPLKASFTEEMKKHLLNYFLRYDCGAVPEFNQRRPVDTALKATIKEMTVSVPEQFMQQYTWKSQYAKRGMTLDELWKDFMSWVDEMSIERKYMGKSGVSFGMKIARFVRMEKKKLSGKTTNMYFPVATEEEEQEDPEIITPEDEDTT
jgi:tRNA-dihydrouridine synthase